MRPIWFVAFIGASLLAGARLAAAPAVPAVPKEFGGDIVVTLERGGRPLQVVLEELSPPGGPALQAGDGLRDQKVTVRFSGLPLGDAARALAAAVDGTWRAQARADGSRVYRLDPSDHRLERLNAYRTARAAAESSRDRTATRKLADRLSGREPKPRTDGPDPPILSLRSRPEPLYPLLRALPQPLLQRWITEANECVLVQGGFGPDPTPSLVVPVAAFSPELRAAITEFLERLAAEQAADGPDRSAEATRAAARHAEDIRLEFWALRSEHQSKERLDLTGFVRLVLPGAGWAYDTVPVRVNEIPLPKMLDAPEELRPAGAPARTPAEDTQRLNLASGRARSDRALLEIARAAKLNLAADYFTRREAMVLMARDRPLGTLLAEAAQLFSLHHFRVGSTWVARSRDWALLTDREPPVAVIDRWEQAKEERGVLSADDYASAAVRLTDLQVPALSNHNDERGIPRFPFETTDLMLNRRALRAYATLTPDQLRRAAVREGLPFSNLSEPQAVAWQRAVLPYSFGVPPQRLQRARLRIVDNGARGGVPQIFLTDPPDTTLVHLAPYQR